MLKSVKFFALTGAGALLAVVGLSSGAWAENPPAAEAAAHSTHASQPLPAALRPALYRALAHEAGAAYRINDNGCAELAEQGLKACFDADGAHFTGATPLSLRLVAFGRSGELNPVGAVAPSLHGNRVSYAHGNLTAWWRVLPLGFEQGFTLSRRPAGHGALTLALSASRKDTGASRAATLAWGKLRYGKLVVTDAEGKVVPATLKSEGNHILIAVNDARAVYPLTVDPLVWISQKVAASDGAPGDLFGFSVALSGATALIGAPYATTNGHSGQGVVYVFGKNNGTRTHTGEFAANNGVAGGNFGATVAVSGATALIGAPYPTTNGHSGQGVAYVFRETNGTWTQTAKLTPSDGAAGNYFGASVALSGATALIGAPFATTNGNAEQGVAYVFGETNGTWTQAAELTASDGAAGDEFGASIALSGATTLISAPAATTNGHFEQGVAYVFGELNGAWTQRQELTASDAAVGDYFGDSVALSGATALIGAPFASSGAGAAYVFGGSSGTWTQTATLAPSTGTASFDFGYAVALSGPTALVGALAPRPGTQMAEGYVFSESNGAWTQSQKLVASDATLLYNRGAVALDGASALLGANSAGSTQSGLGPGAAFFYGASDLGLALGVPQTIITDRQYVSQAIVTNSSSAASPAVSASIAVPAAASFISASATQGSCSEAAGTVTCDFGAIGGNAGRATANVTFKATGSSGGTIENTVGIAHATPPLTTSAATRIVKDHPPVANDGTLTTDENKVASGTLKASDADGDPLTFSIVSKAGHGTVKITDASKGGFTYTPDQNYVGADSFTFKASDGTLDSNTATVSVTVKAVNHPPVASNGTLTTDENQSASGTLAASDADGDALTFSIVSKPAHGTVTITDASTGAYTYTSTQGYSGSDSFTFKASDGTLDSNTATVSITVKAVTPPPPPPPPPPPSGGGGGAFGGLGLLMLLGLALVGAGLKLRRS